MYFTNCPPWDQMTGADQWRILSAMVRRAISRRRLRVPPDDLDDLINTAWIHATEHNDNSTPAELLAYRAAEYAATRATRAHNRAQTMGEYTDTTTDKRAIQSDVEAQTIMRDTIQRAQRDDTDRAICALIASGESIRATARALGLSPAAVHKRLTAIRSRILAAQLPAV